MAASVRTRLLSLSKANREDFTYVVTRYALERLLRATAARMIAAAHEALRAETRRLLRERLRLSPSELESLVQLLRSQLEVSLVRLLGTEGPSP